MSDFDELGDFIEPVTASECFNKAIEFFERGKFENALYYIDEAIEKSYFGVDVYLIRAQILLELEKPEEANEDIEIALAQEPDNTELIIWHARIQTALSNTDTAVRILDDLLESEPTNSEALLSKAMIHYMESNFDYAEEALLEIYDDASGMPEQSAVSAYWLAKIRQMQSRNVEALEYYSISLGLAPFFSYVYNDYADLLRQERRLEEAEDVFLQGVNLFPENAALANDYANLLRELNRDEESIEYLKLAIKHDPTLIQAFYNLGLSYQKIDQHEDAIVYFEKVVDDNPDDTEAKVRLAESLFELGKLDPAYDQVYQACEIEPNNTEFIVVFSDIANELLSELEMSTNWDKAIEVYIAMFSLSIDIFKPKHSNKSNADAVDRLLKTFRQLEVYKPEDSISIKLFQSHINFIRFNHALLIFEFISENEDLMSYQVQMHDEFLEYFISNIGVIREISRQLDNESDSLAYYGYYLQAIYYWRVKNQQAEAETNLFKALNHCENNLAALLHVKAQFYKSIFDFRESILNYLKIYRHDKNAIWIYREISRLYATLRNSEAAIYYHQKYVKLAKEYLSSGKENAKMLLDSAALWLAYGNYDKCKREISRCKKFESNLNVHDKSRLKLLEIFIAVETKADVSYIDKLFNSIVKKSDELKESRKLELFFNSLYCRFYKKYWALWKPHPKSSNNNGNISILEYLPDMESFFQANNKRKINVIFNKLNSKLKIQNYNEIADYFQDMIDYASNSSCLDFPVNLLAPILRISEQAWGMTHDLAHYPEEFAYLRRVANIKACSMLRNANTSKDYEKLFDFATVLHEISPVDGFTRTLLLYVAMLRRESYDFLMLSGVLKAQERLQKVRDLIILGKLSDAEDVIYLENLDNAQTNFELAKIRALQSFNEDALIHLENFLDDGSDRDVAESVVKSHFAFDPLRTENAGFYRLFMESRDSLDEDTEDYFDDDDSDDDSDNTSVMLDLLNELDKDLENLQILQDVKEIEPEINSFEKKTENPSGFDKPKPVQKKSQSKKIDSSKDNSSDSDDSA